jgi:transcriptional regulator with XRE-family HTH domain
MGGVNMSGWLTQRYLDWQKEIGERRSTTEFAAYLEVPASSLSDWLNGKNRPKSERNIRNIAKKLGPEIYDLLDLPRPEEEIPLSHLPPGVRRRVILATREADRALKEHGLTGEMPEAETLTIQIFEKYGFKHTNTEYDV